MRVGIALAVLGACAPVVRVPREVRDYDLLVTGRDTLSEALVVAFEEAGVTVRRQVRGGNEPTAALLLLAARHAPTGARGWLEIQLVDTRRGATVADAWLELDSLPAAAMVVARAIRDSLGLSPTNPQRERSP